MAEYYVSPGGNDENEGSDPSSPLRTITRAVELIALAYADRGDIAVPEFVHLEPGVYSRDSGESFPIIIPALTEVQGSSPDECFIEYSPGEGPFACGYSDTNIELHGSLTDVTLTTEFPEDLWFPVIGVRLMDENAVLENVVGNLIWVDAAARLSQVSFEGALITRDGFERSGEIYPLIDDCHFTNTGSFNSGMGFHIYGGRVQHCTGLIFWINSPGRTVIQDNDLPLIRVFMVHHPIEEAAAESDDLIPRILNNNIQSLDVMSTPDSHWSANRIAVFGESYWEGNTIYVQRVYIGSNCEFFENTLGAFRIDVSLSAPWAYDALGPADEFRANCPEFSSNTFEQVYYRGVLPFRTGDEPDEGSFLTITAEACPVFEHNDFMMLDTEPLTPVFIQKYTVAALAEIVDGLPNPDFGGGVGSSDGGNLFHVSSPVVPHIKIDMAAETYHLEAEDNIWSYEPNIEVIGDEAEVTYDLGEVVLE